MVHFWGAPSRRSSVVGMSYKFVAVAMVLVTALSVGTLFGVVAMSEQNTQLRADIVTLRAELGVLRNQSSYLVNYTNALQEQVNLQHSDLMQFVQHPLRVCRALVLPDYSDIDWAAYDLLLNATGAEQDIIVLIAKDPFAAHPNIGNYPLVCPK